MITCPYCASELKAEQENVYCSFCDIVLGPDSEWGMWAEDGTRVPGKKIKGFITADHAEKSVKELVSYHTYDLLVCLRLAREERTKAYDLLKTFNKALDQGGVEFAEDAAAQGKVYEYWTKRCWVLENILMDRMGYFPERITDDILLKMEAHSLRAQQRKMKISRERKVASKI
ncbi:hypothetical protein P9850_12200 [Anoxybacillus rupiensis]|uniref:Zinc ribbon domain-containing protein n=1 Tax=Anoxybacteroides rupiense TaxID=311460 RepID=A0ABD5IY75_9BACL|nr:hypothetical protein [Anoxybacillus rupiensis]